MLTINEGTDYAVITAAGTLNKGDYERFVPEFERITRKRGRIAMLIDATGLEGWDLQGGWRDLKFDATHQDAFGPMAIISDERWQEWGTKLSKPFFRAPMRFFRPEEAHEARRWLQTTMSSQGPS